MPQSCTIYNEGLTEGRTLVVQSKSVETLEQYVERRIGIRILFGILKQLELESIQKERPREENVSRERNREKSRRKLMRPSSEASPETTDLHLVSPSQPENQTKIKENLLMWGWIGEF